MRNRWLYFLSVFVLFIAMTACSSRETGQVGAPESVASAVEQSSQPEEMPEEPQASEADESEPEASQEEGQEVPQSQAGQPQEESSAAAESLAAVTAPAIVEPTAFNYNASEVTKVYARDYSNSTYIPLDSNRVQQVVPILLKSGQVTAEEIYSRTEGGYFIVLDNGEKFSYTLIPTAVRVGVDAYPISQENYDFLVAVANEAISAGPAYIQWLVYMRPDWIVSAAYQTDTMDAATEIPKGNILSAARALAGIQVKPGSGNTYEDKKSFVKQPGNTVIKLTFDGNIAYSILIENGMLYIESSDMSYGCSYQISTSESGIGQSLNALLPA